MVARVPRDVNQASVICVVLYDCVESDLESVLVLVASICQFEYLVSTFAAQRRATFLINGHWRAHVLKNEVVSTRHFCFISL